MTPNRKSRALVMQLVAGRGTTLLEILACVLILAIALPSLFSLQSGSDRSLVKAGEFMVATAVLRNAAEIYKVRPFEEIGNTTLAFDEAGNPLTSGRGAFQVRVAVETSLMPNRWAAIKKISLEVEKPGTFFGNTLLRTALIRSTWVREL